MTEETPDDPFESDEDAAAAEAAAIGGKRPNYYDNDESQRPLEEAGEGEAEGFELAEEDLIEETSHGEEGRDPELDGFEDEEDAGSVYGEADDVEDPDA